MPERLGMEHVTVHVAPKSDKLIERITALSTPRDFHLEKLPEGLIDSLPSEGNMSRHFQQFYIMICS